MAALGVLAAIGYVAIALSDRLSALLVVSAVTMVNGMGRDGGPAAALEQALLPSTTSDEKRTWTMAWYNASIDVGHALGAGAAILPSALSRWLGVTDAYPITFFVCGVILATSVVPYAFLSVDVEQRATAVRARVACG